MLWPVRIRDRITRNIRIRGFFREAVIETSRNSRECVRDARGQLNVRNARTEVIEVDLGIQESTSELLVENRNEQSIRASDDRHRARLAVVGMLRLQLGGRRGRITQAIV